MESGAYRYLFGPVRSRRLGRSLGIDLVPLKTCTFECPYCQLGGTTTKTLDRREYVPADEVVAEFESWLSTDGMADSVTLAGSGEPTLHSRFGDLLDAVARRTPIRRVLLSNGSLFSQPAVRAAAAKASVVKGTLSAWDQPSFERLHRPHPTLRFEPFLDGFRRMREEFTGEFWLEVFLVHGVNDHVDQVGRIAALAAEIRPDRIHLNTAIRPPARRWVGVVPAERLEELAALFHPAAEVVAISRAPAPAAPAAAVHGALLTDRVAALIRRHPATAAEIAAALGAEDTAVEGALKVLLDTGAAESEQRGHSRYYSLTPAAGSGDRWRDW